MAEIRIGFLEGILSNSLRGLGFNEKVGCCDALLNLLELALRPRQLNEKGHDRFPKAGLANVPIFGSIGRLAARKGRHWW